MRTKRPKYDPLVNTAHFIVYLVVRFTMTSRLAKRPNYTHFEAQKIRVNYISQMSFDFPPVFILILINFVLICLHVSRSAPCAQRVRKIQSNRTTTTSCTITNHTAFSSADN